MRRGSSFVGIAALRSETEQVKPLVEKVALVELLPADSAVLFLFLYLLPGFLGLVVYGYLREGKPTENFDRVVIAFALALVSGILVHAAFQMPAVPMQPGPSNPALGIVLQSRANLNLLARSLVAANRSD